MLYLSKVMILECHIGFPSQSGLDLFSVAMLVVCLHISLLLPSFTFFSFLLELNQFLLLPRTNRSNLFNKEKLTESNYL